jgi:hypothetical protein
MRGHLIVSMSPFIAVTGEDGSFTFTGLPAGKHLLEAWHERAGTRVVEVEVPAGGTASAAFVFPARELRAR